jgi:hypothetical protein
MKRFLVLLLLAGCASGSGPGSAPERERMTTRISGTDGSAMFVHHMHERGRSSLYVPAAIQTVWPAVLQSYDELALPLTMLDPAARTVGMMDQRLKEIGGRSVAHYFNCGGGFGNDAHRFDVFVTSRTQLVADTHSGTRVQIEVDARAKAPTQSTHVRCRSTGTLERELAERIQQKSVNTGS